MSRNRVWTTALLFLAVNCMCVPGARAQVCPGFNIQAQFQLQMQMQRQSRQQSLPFQILTQQQILAQQQSQMLQAQQRQMQQAQQASRQRPARPAYLNKPQTDMSWLIQQRKLLQERRGNDTNVKPNTNLAATPPQAGTKVVRTQAGSGTQTVTVIIIVFHWHTPQAGQPTGVGGQTTQPRPGANLPAWLRNKAQARQPIPNMPNPRLTRQQPAPASAVVQAQALSARVRASRPRPPRIPAAAYQPALPPSLPALLQLAAVMKGSPGANPPLTPTAAPDQSPGAAGAAEMPLLPLPELPALQAIDTGLPRLLASISRARPAEKSRSSEKPPMPEDLLQPPLLPSGVPVLNPLPATSAQPGDETEEANLFDALQQPPPLPSRPRSPLGAS